ncbi:DEAD/DEAH box helicase [Actinotalea sp. Marseille-Q4924]|uniref:DEAD/DEAH box helicase n=1 Tax=Actinotalea sp. Marseille-Q4924 TaxID=2866571 RepID=UPI001CE4703A|nr:DEAD/DEAH box helicase [Actinotalea sp. Marseille-Q4924]
MPSPHSPDAPEPTADERLPDLVELGLPEALLQAVLDLGFVRPTPIQAATIPVLLAGRDVTGVAQTGTGKTAAFGLPLLAAVEPATRAVQALVLTPTRELAQQVAEAITTFARRTPGVRVVAVYGGAPFLPQQRALAAGAQVVVGTPGRVMDHLDRGTLSLDAIRMLVLDEADEMLRMGFAEDVERIFGAAPQRRQVALFSATMPPGIVAVASQHLVDPVRVAVDRESSTVTAVKQSYAVVPYRHKIGALARVLATADAGAAIVFTRTRSAAEEVGLALVARGLSAATISGDVAQKDREKIIDRLRTGALDTLVATDVAARGLDVERVGLVVNFDVPGEPEAYVHRIGRTGRAGREGRALTFVTPKERHKLRAIERTTRQRLEEVPLPTPADVSRHRIVNLLARTPERHEAGRTELYRSALQEHVETSGMDLLDVAAALAALAVGDDRSTVEEEPEVIEEAFAPDGGTRYRLAVGHRHGVRPEAVVGALTGEGGLTGRDIGKIDIFSGFTLVEITASLGEETLRRIAAARVAGQPLRIRVDEGRPGRSAAAATSHPGTHHHEPRTPRRTGERKHVGRGAPSRGTERPGRAPDRVGRPDERPRKPRHRGV